MMLGMSNYEKISIGDLISWREKITDPYRRFAIVIKKYISMVGQREVAVLKVVTSDNNQIKNILAISVDIESKNTI